jgi:hypothetical protein
VTGLEARPELGEAQELAVMTRRNSVAAQGKTDRNRSDYRGQSCAGCGCLSTPAQGVALGVGSANAGDCYPRSHLGAFGFPIALALTACPADALRIRGIQRFQHAYRVRPVLRAQGLVLFLAQITERAVEI